MCIIPSITSCVQTGGSLAAVQLPLLYLEVGTGPLQTSMASKFSEELQHGLRAPCATASGNTDGQPFFDTSAAASVPGLHSHHLSLNQDRYMDMQKTSHEHYKRL